MSIESAQETYQRFLRDEASFDSGWSIFKNVLHRDTVLSRGARLTSKNESQLSLRLKNRELVEKVLAAELFPNRTPMEIVVANSPLENHDALREKSPKGEPRLSGEIVSWGKTNFFVIDGFSVKDNSYFLDHVSKSANDILNFLLDHELVPVDAFFNIVPFSK